MASEMNNEEANVECEILFREIMRMCCTDGVIKHWKEKFGEPIGNIKYTSTSFEISLQKDKELT